jgi:hypothetical protein
MLRLLKLQCLVVKYSPTKFANFVLICITRGKMHHIWAESEKLYDLVAVD